MSLPAKDLRPPILCYVTDRNSIALQNESPANRRAALLERIAAAAAAGIDWIQIREKDLSAREFSSLVREAILQAKQSAPALNQFPRILVNDRLDIAITEQAAGIHLGENSLPVGNVRAWLRSRPPSPATKNFLVGVSCHSKETAISAACDGADYIFFGPIFTTPSKAAYGAPQGPIASQMSAAPCPFPSWPSAASPPTPPQPVWPQAQQASPPSASSKTPPTCPHSSVAFATHLRPLLTRKLTEPRMKGFGEESSGRSQGAHSS